MAKTKKRNFTDCEVEVLIDEVTDRRQTLFGGQSSGVTNSKKAYEWQHVTDAVNAVASQGRTMAEIKKKWSDMKVEAKKSISAHRQSVTATGGGEAGPELSEQDAKIAGVIGEKLLSGVVTEQEGDTDAAPQETVPDDACGEAGASSWSVPAQASGPSPKPASGRVLTDAVLQVQRDHVEAVREVASELKDIKKELFILNENIKEFMKK
ncbi:nuclear apoptosis-inducing factor 1-like [Engraulis encrasicolus]|uniref:nuclear apoptosis-inducing factor 1-like n=1 Tax=Engraulis encrasicolus TaxID=184585 RepID=UPI002FD43BF0